jgi:uncharacterized protein
MLFEGDRPSPTPASGPGHRYALGPTGVSKQPELVGEPGELPEAYGTKRLFLTARDPHWLYAHWDFSAAQLQECNAASADRHLVLRVYVGELSGAPHTEVHVHRESRNWFVHVGSGGTRYIAELGYYRARDREWVRVSTSGATLTPPDALAPDTEVEFATIPLDVPLSTLVSLVQAAAMENVPLAEAIMQLQAAGHPGLPHAADWPRSHWTPQQEQALTTALARSMTMDQVRRVWVGSLEITELLRRRLHEARGSAEFAAPRERLGAFASGAGGVAGGVSSPPGGMPGRGPGFWFQVNAELVVYGATEPGATVTVGGREIRLRADGTFSFRFSLPDGSYELPAVAVAADGSDRRVAALEFRRATSYQGQVGVHPQDPGLKPPTGEAVE